MIALNRKVFFLRTFAVSQPSDTMPLKTADITRIALFAAIMAVSAYIRIPLGVVPLTLQSTAALLTGYILGPARGSLATLTYTVIGLAGLPVFSSGGGPAYVLSPTFGYIIGFTACAWITGFLARRNRSNSAVIAYLIMIVSLAGIYIPGVLWLVAAMRWIADAPPDVMSLLKAGLLVPFAGDLLTTIPAAAVAVRLTTWLDSRNRP